MHVLGLTGSVGMGKSTTAALFKEAGIPVHDADAVVHRLMGPAGQAVAKVEAAFPGTAGPNGIDRKKLGQIVFGETSKLRQLEGILHPLVTKDREKFLFQAGIRRAKLVVFDVPLLFETSGEALCDATVLVTAPHFVQTARFLARPGMTSARLSEIRKKQMSDAAKRRLARYIVPTGRGKRPVRLFVNSLIRDLKPETDLRRTSRLRFAIRHRRPVILASLTKHL